MARLTQGENLNEAPIVGVDGNPVTPPAGDSPPPNAPKFGPKQIAIFAGVAVLVVIIIIVILSRGGSSEGGESGDSGTSSASASDDEEEWLVNPNPDPNWGQSVQSSEPDPNTNRPDGGGDPVNDPFTYCFYTEEEVQSLRGYGFTGDEIEYHSQQRTPFDTLKKQAEDEYSKKYEEWKQSVLDEASPGYKNLMDKTFLNSEQTSSTCEKSEVKNYGTRTENVDYDKCGVYNMQPWIKCHTSIGDLMMSPELTRYSELEDSGNIVVVYDYAIDGNGNMLYITGIREKAIR